jgi:hypothetical protein
LQEYLDRFPDSGKRIPAIYPQERTPRELVRYALAVRHARREEYDEAAQVYQALLVSVRVRRMRTAAKLVEAVRDTSMPAGRHLQAQYDYAVFLANNSERVFYNDSLWGGIQTWAFQVEPGQVDPHGIPYAGNLSRQEAMTPEEVNHFKQLERSARDQQEEYWRAYLILNDIVANAGHTPLGRKAAEKAIFCLRRIAVHRFGRARDIRAADIRLSNWLLKGKP